MTGARAELIAPGDEDDFVRPRFELFVDIGDKRVQSARVADEPSERLAVSHCTQIGSASLYVL